MDRTDGEGSVRGDARAPGQDTGDADQDVALATVEQWKAEKVAGQAARAAATAGEGAAAGADAGQEEMQ